MDTIPGLPVANPTISYWQAQSQDSPIHNHGEKDALPDSCVDVAIIGSGMSGAVAAYFLQQQNLALKIVMLEARQACSGATGRNGGHCRPDSFLGFDGYSRILGKEQAHKVLVNEWDTFSLTREIIEKEKIQCDWWNGLTMTVYLLKEEMERAKQSYENYRQYTTLRPDVRFVDDPVEASKLSRIPDAIGAAVFPAGSFYPLRFVHALLSLCLSKGSFQLFTHLPVKCMERKDLQWHLYTHRGVVKAKKVLMATNGYSQALLPSLDNFVISHRAHCSSVIPPLNYGGANSLKLTCSVVGEKGNYEYMIQRPNNHSSDNAIILGGGHTIVKKEIERGSYDDSYLDAKISKFFSSYGADKFAGWKSGQGKLTHAWTGIQGYTRDGVPIVGHSLQEEDLFLSTSFCGHGMAWSQSCARGIARLMTTDRTSYTDKEWENLTGLPACFRWTQSRADRIDVDCR